MQTKGALYLTTQSQKQTTINAIVVLEDTVFSAIRIAGTDVKATYIAAPATAVKAGTIIRAIQCSTV